MTKRKVSVRKGFSDRNGFKLFNTVIQVDSLDDRSRGQIAVFISEILRHLESLDDQDEHSIVRKILADIFNEPITLGDELYLYQIAEDLNRVCLKDDFDDVLTLLEGMCNIVEYYDECDENQRGLWTYSAQHRGSSLNWYEQANKVLENECVGYRFVNGVLVGISSEAELASINSACSTPFDQVNQHIQKAIMLIGANSNHDYKNSIKESSLALECLLNIIGETNGLSLGQALNNLLSKLHIHEAFKKSLTSFYGYCSDSSGIRHDTNKSDYCEGFDEAKLVLVNTSGFINYLISISQK